MANVPVAAGLTVQQWDDKFFTEYIRENRFKKYMGMDENSAIQMKEDLTTKQGKTVTYALVNALSGAGVTGSNTLVGNEEKMMSRSCTVTVNKIRNAVVVPEIDEQFSAISLRDAGKVVLKNWILDKTKDDIINALGQVSGDYYGGMQTIWTDLTAGATNQDAWVTNNSDRVLFGQTTSNYGTDFSAALANVDATNDLITAARISLMKSLAKEASPNIRPIRVNGDEEWYLVFMNTRSFKKFSEDTAVTAANRDARVRGLDNPLFTGGDLIWDGMIIREIPEIPTLGAVGASSAVVSPVFLVGAQALGFAIAKRTYTITDNTDYEDKQGVSANEIRGIQKLKFGTDGSVDTTTPKDHGIFTGFFATPALTSA